MASAHLTKNPDVQELHKDEDDIAQAKAIAIKAGIGLITYPLTFSKTLFQLGFEPYPSSTGKIFVFVGREGYFLPNAFKYIRNIYKEFGLSALYRGVEAGLIGTVAGGFAAYYAEKYIDTYHQEIGGEKVNDDKNDEDLSNYESFRVHLRHAIRRSISSSIGIVVTHPFTVLMIREIAQHVGGEYKYPNVFSGLLRVGDEEGLSGLFAGIVPILIANFIRTWGIAGLSYAASRLLIKAERSTADKNDKEAVRNLRKYTPYIIPFTVNALSYPFEVCATVFAVTGSHLAVSMLPYAPSFNHWTDTYDYLKPNGLSRGARLFLRERC